MPYRVSINVGSGEESKKTVIGVGNTRDKAVADAIEKLSQRLSQDGRAEVVGAEILVEESMPDAQSIVRGT